VDKNTLPQNRPKPLTAEEIARRKLAARERHTQMMAQVEAGLHSTALEGKIQNFIQFHVLFPIFEFKIEAPVEQKEEEKKVDEPPEDDVVFVAFARVFSGTVKMGQTLYVLGPKHDPKEAIAKVNNKSLLGLSKIIFFWFTVK